MKSIRSSYFARGLATVFSGAVVAQAFGLLVLPIFSRLFAPEAFGQLLVYQSLLTVLSIAVTSRFELALLSCDDDEAKEVVESAFCIVVILAFILGLMLFLLNLFQLVPILGTIPFAIPYIILALAATGLTNLFFYRLLRSHKFRENVTLKLSQAIFYSLVGLGIGFANPSYDGLIIADLSGRIAAVLIAMIFFAKYLDIGWPGLARLKGLKKFILKYQELPKYALPGALMSAAGATISPFMIYAVFGSALAGQFGLVDRAMTLPIAMIINAVSQVYVARFSELYRQGDIAMAYGLFKRTVAISFCVAALGALVIWLALPFLFLTVFGPQWEYAGELSQIMIIAYVMSFCAGTVNQTLVSIKKYRLMLILGVASPVTYTIMWYVAIQTNLDIKQAVMAHAAVIVFLQGSFVALAAYALKRRFLDKDPCA